MTKKEDFFETTDLSLAAALGVFGFYCEVSQTSYKKSTFCFSTSKELIATIDKYWQHSLKVEPLAFFNMLKELKARVYGNEQIIN